MQRAEQTTLRAFLALDFDDDALGVLSTYLRQLRASPWANDVRWVSPDNLHLTLRFLGDITPAQVTGYASALRKGLAHIANLSSLTLVVSPPRLFPRPSRPRLIACLIESNPTLAELAALAERCAIGIGLAPERRPFNGHITLGRLRDSFPRDAALPERGSAAHFHPGAITLYRSDLNPQGAVYTALHTFSLTSQL